MISSVSRGRHRILLCEASRAPFFAGEEAENVQGVVAPAAGPWHCRALGAPRQPLRFGHGLATGRKDDTAVTKRSEVTQVALSVDPCKYGKARMRATPRLSPDSNR